MPGKPRFDSDAVRALVRKRLEESSERELAGEIGISRGALEGFLDGRSPYTNTRLHLAAWQMRQRDPDARLARAEVEAAVDLIEWYIDNSPTEAIRTQRVRELAKRLGL